MVTKRNRGYFVCEIQKRRKMLCKLERFIGNLSRRPMKPELRKVIRGLRYLQDGVNTDEHRWVMDTRLFQNSRLLRLWHSMVMDLSI